MDGQRDADRAEDAQAESRRADRLGFTVSGDAHFLPLQGIVEVLRPRALSRVPGAPPSLLGIAKLRGAALPVVSAARLIGREQVEATPRSRILVLDRDGACGLLVDGLATADDVAPAFDAEALLTAAFERQETSRRPLTERGTSPPQRPGRTAATETPALLGFAVAGRTYALPLGDIEAVLAACPTPTSVADGDPVVAGVVEHGGDLPVVVLARLLGGSLSALRGPLVVARLPAGRVGLLVEALRGILRLPTERLDEVPVILTRGAGETRIDRIARCDDGSLVSILSVVKLFDEATQERLSALGGRCEGQTPAAEEEQRERFVAVDIGMQRFGIPVAAVAEVERQPDRLATVPGTPPFILGAMALRGRPVPVVDGSDRLGLPSQQHRRDGPALVLTVRDAWFALAVDAVVGMIEVAANAIAPLPLLAASSAAKSREACRRVTYHHGSRVLLVDPEAVLDEAGCVALATAAGFRSKVAAIA